jgi:hypothetical protein
MPLKKRLKKRLTVQSDLFPDQTEYYKPT